MASFFGRDLVSSFCKSSFKLFKGIQIIGNDSERWQVIDSYAEETEIRKQLQNRYPDLTAAGSAAFELLTAREYNNRPKNWKHYPHPWRKF